MYYISMAAQANQSPAAFIVSAQYTKDGEDIGTRYSRFTSRGRLSQSKSRAKASEMTRSEALTTVARHTNLDSKYEGLSAEYTITAA